jgi:heat-inducible transcriptional repressor
MLDDRKSRILQSLVEEHIRTGEPVSSQAILDHSDLDVSSATVRNELAALEAYGFITQPHTSSGRIPTRQGYRYYVDHGTPGHLRVATHARIEAFFADVHREVSRLLKETSGLLTDLTRLPAVVIGPERTVETLHAVHLVRLGGPVVLVVTVAESGGVGQQIVSLGFEPSDHQLDEAERVIEAVYRGRARPDVSDDERLSAADVPDVVRRIVGPVHEELQGIQSSHRDMFVGGTSQLAELWADLATVQEMLGLLERESELQMMLGDDTTEGTTVRIGGEFGDEMDVAVVSAPFGSNQTGRLGVIGPMRMDYRRAIRVVEEVGEGLGERLGTESGDGR